MWLGAAEGGTGAVAHARVQGEEASLGAVGLSAVFGCAAAGLAGGGATAWANRGPQPTAGPPAPGGTHALSEINPTGGVNNCGLCAVALDNTLSGRPSSALSDSARPHADLPDGITFTDEVAEAVGRTQQNWLFVDAPDPSFIVDAVQSGGPGTRGIVFGGRGPTTDPDIGHFFNVVNQGGEVRFLDGQTGNVVADFDYDWFGFLGTN